MMNRFLICSKAVMINNLLRGVLGIIAVALLCFVSSVEAENKFIKVKYSGDKIFNENNIYPGWSKSEKVTVQNRHTTDVADLYITVKINKGKKLAGKLKYYVIRKSDKNYRIGGSGDKYTLKEADGEMLYIGKLAAGERKEFDIKIKFNKDAGNEYQGLSTEMDMVFKIEGDLDSSSSEDDILNSQGRTRFTGNAPNEDDIIVSAEDTPETAGIQYKKKEGVASNDDTEVKGEVSCHGGWPLWMWLLLLLTGSVGIYFVGGFKNEKLILPVQAAVIVGIFALWYFIDGCGSFKFVPYADVIGGFAIVGALYNQRAKLKA